MVSQRETKIKPDKNKFYQMYSEILSLVFFRVTIYGFLALMVILFIIILVKK